MRIKLIGSLLALLAFALAGCDNKNDHVLQGWVEAELIFVSSGRARAGGDLKGARRRSCTKRRCTLYGR